MRKQTAILVLIACVMLLSACGLSEAEIQEAIEKTQIIEAEQAVVSLPTNEPTSTPDTWVIEGDLRDYLLTEEDIASEGYDFHFTRFGFYESEYEITNDDLIDSEYYDEFDDALIFDLGRITAWERSFMSSEKDADGEIWESHALKCAITSFQTVDAARQAVERYNDAEKPDSMLTLFNKELDLGDVNVIYRGGLVTAIEFSYRNVAVRIRYTEGQDLEITELFARIVLEKLQKAPLAAPIESSIALPTNHEINSVDSKADKYYGFYLVGSEIASGNWRNTGNSDNCYWAITDSKGEIIENYFGMTGGTMYVPNTAFQVELDKECGIWKYLGN